MQCILTRSTPQSALASSQLSCNRNAKRSVIVCAQNDQTSRRATFGALIGAAILLGSNSAEAKTKIPFFDSIKRGGSSTEASQSSFDMTGIKKRGLKKGQRRELLDGVREKADSAVKAITPGKK